MTESRPSKSGSLFDMKWNETNEIPTVSEYRTLSIPCLLAFLAGLLSPLVLISWGLVFLPILALALALAGLYGVERSEGMQFGKPLAWSGVFLAICFSVMNVTLWEAYKSNVIREAIVFADHYFELYDRGPDDPELDILHVHDMRSPYWLRSAMPIEDRWKAIEKDTLTQEDIGGYSGQLPERTLMALGGRAVPTYYSVKSYGYAGSDYVTLVYAITYETDAKEKETFFLELRLKRTHGEDTTTIANQKIKRGGWSVESLKAPVLPKEFGGKET